MLFEFSISYSLDETFFFENLRKYMLSSVSFINLFALFYYSHYLCFIYFALQRLKETIKEDVIYGLWN